MKEEKNCVPRGVQPDAKPLNKLVPFYNVFKVEVHWKYVALIWRIEWWSKVANSGFEADFFSLAVAELLQIGQNLRSNFLSCGNYVGIAWYTRFRTFWRTL